MVKALGTLISWLVGWLQESLEVVGTLLACAFVAIKFGGVYILAVLAVAFLLKSLEVDILSRDEP